jgi:hypothetical protein
MSESEGELEAAVDAVIAECEGNMRATIRVLVLANGYLEAEVARQVEAVSKGYARGDVGRQGHRRDQ